MSDTFTRPEVMVGKTHRVRATIATGQELTVYVTVNSVDAGLAFKPWELFLNCLDSTYHEHFAVVGLMISRQLQAGIEAETVARDLQQIHSAVTGHFVPGRGMSPSLYARIGDVLLTELGLPLVAPPKVVEAPKGAE